MLACGCMLLFLEPVTNPPSEVLKASSTYQHHHNRHTIQCESQHGARWEWHIPLSFSDGSINTESCLWLPGFIEHPHDSADPGWGFGTLRSLSGCRVTDGRVPGHVFVEIGMSLAAASPGGRQRNRLGGSHPMERSTQDGQRLLGVESLCVGLW